MIQLPRQPGVHYLEDSADLGTFTLVVPPEIDSRPVPLVLSLHYLGSGIRFYGAGLLIDVVKPALEELGAILVAPDCMASVWHNQESEKQVIELLNLLFGSYNIDRKRTLVTGYSMGGIGTWFLAGRHQDLFTIAVPMAARPPSAAVQVEWQIPIFAIHGSRDQLFPLADTLRIIDHIRSKGAALEMTVVEGASHFETGRFQRPLRQLVPSIAGKWASSE